MLVISQRERSLLDVSVSLESSSFMHANSPPQVTYDMISYLDERE